MTLDRAKFIADHNVGMYSRQELLGALERLEQTRGRIYGGLSNDRIVSRFERRIARLQQQLETIR